MTPLEYMNKMLTKHRANFDRESKRGCPATMMHDILMKIYYYEAAVKALEKESRNAEN